MRNVVIATTSSWFSEEDISEGFGDISWEFITSTQELTPERISEIQPEKIFFMHWNQKIPREIFGEWECILFHTAPLPIGRGGTPIQNLIERGYTRTPLNALRVTGELDAGPVYGSREIELQGSLAEIFARIRVAAAELVEFIIRENPIPFEQQGEPLVFTRRPPESSEIDGEESLEELYDKIRMVDYEGYPRAFFYLGKYKLTFSNATLSEESLSANVIVTELTN